MRRTRDPAQAAFSSPSCFPSQGSFSKVFSLAYKVQRSRQPPQVAFWARVSPGAGMWRAKPPGAAASAVPALAHLCPHPSGSAAGR